MTYIAINFIILIVVFNEILFIMNFELTNSDVKFQKYNTFPISVNEETLFFFPYRHLSFGLPNYGITIMKAQ